MSKNDFKIECNLVDITDSKCRKAHSKLRPGSNKLEIELGTYNNVPSTQRVCKMCRLNEVDDENHFVCRCTYFEDIRQSNIQNTFTNCTRYQYRMLMSNTTNTELMLHLARYTYNEFKRKENNQLYIYTIYIVRFFLYNYLI